MKISKKVIVYAINSLLLILVGICLWRCYYYSNILLSQQAAKFWAGESEERFTQVSCFLPVNETVNEDEIFSFRMKIDKKLAEAGIEPKIEGEYWDDAYSTTSTISVKGDRSSSEATVIGVGGDFFSFHPYLLLSGSYLNADDLMKDRVVLDYDLAWKLFGGIELEGMTVKINETPYYIAGVIRRETDKFSKKAFTGEPAIYMPYSTLTSLKEDLGISCYEISLPEPISGFAKAFAKESFPIGNGVIVENSTRYDFQKIYDVFKNFGSRSISTNGVIYPYWENAARIAEVYIARLYVVIVLLAVIPFICIVILVFRLIRFLIAKLKRLGFKLWDAWDDRYARREARQERKAQKLLSKNLPHSQEEEIVETRKVKRLLAKIGNKLGRFKVERKVQKSKDKAGRKVKNIFKIKKASRLKRIVKKPVIVEAISDKDYFSEKEVVLDVESIVREILNENASESNQN